MRYIFFVLIFLLFSSRAFALEVVYPKKTLVNINSETTFFIGNTSPKDFLTINGHHVMVHPSGGFAHFVKLRPGQNNFLIKTETEEKNFVINRTKKASGNWGCKTFMKYPSLKYLKTAYDNVPLRDTPVDDGINRLAHYQKGVLLTADGEQNGFYRIVLNENTFGYIRKENTIATERTEPAKINSYKKIKDKEFDIFEFDIDKKAPFSLHEGDSLTLKIYNVKDNDNSTFTFSVPVEKILFGYSGRYEDGKFILKIRKFPKIEKSQPLKDITITIDAGHGGKELGAIGCLGDCEKDINLKIAKFLQEELLKRGANVIMTREDDSNPSLRQRVEISNNANSMIFLSLHNNALPDSQDPLTRRGSSTYYYYNQSKALADVLLDFLNADLCTGNDGVHQRSFAVVRNTESLAVLIEFAYMINPFDNANLVNDDFQKSCAFVIANALEYYFLTNSKK